MNNFKDVFETKCLHFRDYADAIMVQYHNGTYLVYKKSKFGGFNLLTPDDYELEEKYIEFYKQHTEAL